MNHLDHLLIFTPIVARCKYGHDAHLFTSDGAQCSCGKWNVWASTRNEIDYAHDRHLEYIKEKEAETAVHQYQRNVSLHELFWRGPNAAQCKGCSWQVYGLDSSRIVEAFSSHMETVRKEFEK